MAEADKIIGENVAHYRSGMTQKAVATAMKERGHKWSQATVWAVEQGERPLRLAEAEDLSQVLNTDPRLLARPAEEMAFQAALLADQEALDAVKTAAGKFCDARARLSDLLQALAPTDLEQIAESSKAKLFGQLEKTPERALEEGIEQWKSSTRVFELHMLPPRAGRGMPTPPWPLRKDPDGEHHEEA